MEYSTITAAESQRNTNSSTAYVSQDWAKWLTVDDGRTVHEAREHSKDNELRRSLSADHGPKNQSGKTLRRNRSVTFSPKVEVRQFERNVAMHAANHNPASEESEQDQKEIRSNKKDRFRFRFPLSKKSHVLDSLSNVGPKTRNLLFAVGGSLNQAPSKPGNKRVY
mmetsp:Transcript_375/g.434  ORF Transcript_375/g.434 Transcript_375/m.434 type:complete len:166 (+) Transcript_375:461-958(+)